MEVYPLDNPLLMGDPKIGADSFYVKKEPVPFLLFIKL